MVLPHVDYRLIVEHLTTAIMLLHTDLTIHYLNPACENLLELSLARVRGQSIQELISLSDSHLQLSDILYKVSKTRQPYTHREATLNLGLKERFVDYTVTLFESTTTSFTKPSQQADHQTLIFIELQAIDRLLRVAKEEFREQQHQATRQMIRGVAHEIKNPLGGIRGATQLLARQLRQRQQDSHPVAHPEIAIGDYTDIIISEVDRLRHLADSLLGSPQLPRYCALNIHEPLEHVLSLLVNQTDCIEIERDYDLSLPEVRADRDQLIQVFLNIGMNAVQAMTEQADFFVNTVPRLVLRTRIKRALTLHGVYHRSVVCVEIEDNGPGIPPHIIETVFYPMVTGRAQGTGLGLSIVQHILRQHQGSIEVESEPGRTLFSICLAWHKG